MSIMLLIGVGTKLSKKTELYDQLIMKIVKLKIRLFLNEFTVIAMSYYENVYLERCITGMML